MHKLTSELDLSEFIKRFDGQIRIAPFAMNIPQLIRSLSDTDMDFHQLATVIHQYPVITARLIALANSAWASPSSPITTLDSACLRLGHSVVKSTSIALAVASSFNVARCPAFDLVRFWTTTMLTAEGARLLATKLPAHVGHSADLPFTAQTGGTLHALGLLWLADNLATQTNQALQRSSADPLLTVSQALIDDIGIDYCSVGAWIGKQWHMPEELICVMQHHRDYNHQISNSTAVILVGMAVKISASLIHEDQARPDTPELQALGIDEDQQKTVFTQLENKLGAMSELAKTLFL